MRPQRTTLPCRLPRFLKRAAIVGLAVAFALLPESASAPAQTVARRTVEIVLSAAPPSGPLVEISLPPGRALSAPVVERPGLERRISGR